MSAAIPTIPFGEDLAAGGATAGLSGADNHPAVTTPAPASPPVQTSALKPAGQPAQPAGAPPALRAGAKVGDLVVAAAGKGLLVLRTPGELGFVRAMIGLVPVIWAAAAWAICLREGVLEQRLLGCLVLTALALGSLAVLASFLPRTWRFDGRRRRVRRTVGPFRKTYAVAQVAGVTIEVAQPDAHADVYLRLALVSPLGKPTLTVAQFNRREIDRQRVEHLMESVAGAMGWKRVARPAAE